MSEYTIKLRFGDTLRVEANLAEASAPIKIINDHDGDWRCEETVTSTPYQTADARHDVRRMARLVLQFLGSDYWLDPSIPIVDTEDEYTINGLSEEAYIDSLIVSVE